MMSDTERLHRALLAKHLLDKCQEAQDLEEVMTEVPGPRQHGIIRTRTGYIWR